MNFNALVEEYYKQSIKQNSDAISGYGDAVLYTDTYQDIHNDSGGYSESVSIDEISGEGF